MGDADPTRRTRTLRWALPAAALAAAGLAGALVAGAGSDDDRGAAGAPATSRSSTIALAADGDSLWLTSPDDDQVVQVDRTTLEPVQRLEVDGQPSELTLLGDRLLATGAQRTSLAVLDLASSPPAAASVELPCGGPRAVVTVPAGVAGTAVDLAAVSCPNDDVVALVDLARGATVGVVSVPGRPTGLARAGEQLHVTTATDGLVHTFPLPDLVAALPAPADADQPATLEVAATTTDAAWADGERSASTLGPVEAAGDGPVAAYQIVDNVRKLSSKQLEGDATYGSPLNGRARLEPALAGPCGARFADFGDDARLLSGPVALAADADQDLVWVVGQFSRSVSVVRCDGGGPAGRTPTLAAFDIGAGARGIAVDPDADTAYVDVGFDHAVAELQLPTETDEVEATTPIERTEPTRVARREVTDRYLSPLAQEGRRMFADATDTHLTPFGVVTCASCHPAAGDDGLAWRIETQEIARKLRRTPPVWQVDADEKPLHWDGQFTTSEDLITTTIRELLGGDALLVDPSAIAAFMAESLPPPARPVRTDAEEALVAQGLAAFDDAGCATCHLGERGTDGLAHDVLPPGDQPAAVLADVITPPLTGVRGRAPFGHDARAADLDALLDQHGDEDGEPIVLSAAERRSIAAYLATR